MAAVSCEELIPSLEALFPRGGSVQDPVRTPCPHMPAVIKTVSVQGYLTSKKCTSLGPYRRPMHRVLWWSRRVGVVLSARYPGSDKGLR